MAANCLVGCTNASGGKIREPIDTAVLMPWVEVQVGTGKGEKISVSNISSKQYGAIISSFQYGGSNGNMVIIEVVDEQSGVFTNFFNRITRGLGKDEQQKWSLTYQWGWTKRDCNNVASSSTNGVGDPRLGPTLVSIKHTLMITGFRCDVSKGYFKFTIDAMDHTVLIRNARDPRTFGTDAKQLPLEQAVTELFKPYGIKVKFGKFVNGNFTEGLDWLMDSGNATSSGILGTWNALNRDPIQAAIDWVFTSVSKKKKGIIVTWDAKTSNDGPTLFFIENPHPDVEIKFDSSSLNVGTYVVNGGSCSPVISFTPQIQWNPAQTPLGTGGYTAVSGEKSDRPITQGVISALSAISDFPNLMTQGLQVEPFWNRVMGAAFLGKAQKKAFENQRLHNVANNFYFPITAELKIQGDPSYSDPVICTGGCYASIVYINPFYIGGSNGSCQWLSEPPCNDILTNRNWRIAGVFHEIREGSYTTTLKLELFGPGQNISVKGALGAATNGYLMPVVTKSK